jgi:hypothetical protein
MLTAKVPAGHSALERRARLTTRLAKLAATGHLTSLALTRSAAAHARSASPEPHPRLQRDRRDPRPLRLRPPPVGELLVRYSNRCPACSTVFRCDTYQLIAAGLPNGPTAAARARRRNYF